MTDLIKRLLGIAGLTKEGRVQPLFDEYDRLMRIEDSKKDGYTQNQVLDMMEIKYRKLWKAGK